MPTALILRRGRLRTRAPQWTAHDFTEADYRHGKGTLRLRLVHVEWSREVFRDGVTWRRTEAVVLDQTGHQLDRRQFLIRADRIPTPSARKRPRLRA